MKQAKIQLQLTTRIVVKEQHWCSEHGGKQPVMEHTRGIDTDDVEKHSTQKVEEDQANCETAISANPLLLVQSTGYGQV